MKYHYNALKIGFVLLSFGLGKSIFWIVMQVVNELCIPGSMAGSILGGRWSDRVLRQLKLQNGGRSYPEMRLESTKLAMIFLPISILAYAWLCEKKVHVSAVCVALFFEGFFSMWVPIITKFNRLLTPKRVCRWMYSSTLAYIVDANTGRSSTAVATNSSFRGIWGFIAAEMAVPLQDSIGDGGLYTLWTGLMILAELILLLVLWKGGAWREAAIERELMQREKRG